jgi:hypothetical protein
VPLAVKWYPSPSGNEWIAVINSGVNLVIDGVDPAGPLDISSDRLVIWTRGQAQPDLDGGGTQATDVPLELYMEGNVIFRQGQRVVEAANMFYDVPRSSGVITGATVLTPVDNYSGAVRLRADVLRQVDRSRFVAQQTGLTSSRLGVPSWEFRSRELEFTDEQVPIPGPYGQPLVDPASGEPAVEHQQFITSRGNTVTLGGVPVLWWPVLATNAKKPTFYLNDLQVKNDRIFGTQVLTGWDAFQVFGWRRPPDGVDWDFDVDYLSKRGPGGGTSLLYNRPGFLGLGTPASGDLDAWFVGDTGIDNVGLNRRNLTYPGYPPRPLLLAAPTGSRRHDRQPVRRLAGPGHRRLDQRHELPRGVLRGGVGGGLRATNLARPAAAGGEPGTAAPHQRARGSLLHADRVVAAARPLLDGAAAGERRPVVVRALERVVRPPEPAADADPGTDEGLLDAAAV